MLRVIKPIAVDDTILVAHSEPEADYAAYNAGTTYALGDRVIYLHAVYESLQASNLAHTPTLTASATWWVKVGPTNRWAMFDAATNTQTVGAGAVLSVTLQVASEFVSALGLVAASGVSASISIVSDGLTVYSDTKTLNGSSSVDFWNYFFGERETVGELIFADLPLYLAAQIVVTVTALTTAKLGALVIGRVYDIGGVRYGAELGIIDYSRKATDSFGTSTFKQGDYARRATLDAMVDKSNLRRVYQLLASLRSTQCLWVGDEDTDAYGPMTIFGWYRTFRQVVDWPTVTHLAIEIEGAP